MLVRSKILSKLICCKLYVILRSRVLGVDNIVCPIRRRLPLELQTAVCRTSYQGQQGDVSQSVRGNYKKKRF